MTLAAMAAMAQIGCTIPVAASGTATLHVSLAHEEALVRFRFSFSLSCVLSPMAEAEFAACAPGVRTV